MENGNINYSKFISGDNVNDRVEYWENVVDGEVFVRGIALDKLFDKDKFLNSKSVDIPPEYLDEWMKFKTEEDVWDVIRDNSLPAIPVCKCGNWGVEYEGVHAKTNYDDMLMRLDLLVIFEGESLGFNWAGDGEIVKPKKVLEVYKIE